MQTFALLTLTLVAHAAADCSCGYTVNKTVEQNFAVFTDMIETDFLHTYNFSYDAAHGIGWLPQTYNQTNSSGPLGMAKMANNVMTNPLASIWDWGGEGIRGGDPGLQLWVKGDVVHNTGLAYVPTAEIVSERDDILYGSFRVAMKTTNVNGTCAAFFFYRNDTQEIDVEVLSAQQHTELTQWPVNFVVQNTTLPLALNGTGDQSSNMEFHMVRQPDGKIGSQYREYRFDWLPNRIDFYIDSWLAYTFTNNIPSSPGAIHFSHWSNGNRGWTYGPPLEDAVMTVAYIKAYFNTTSRISLSSHDCMSPQWRSSHNALCEIPDQNFSPWPGGPMGNDTGKTFFFSRAGIIERNTTDDGEQTVHGTVPDPREGSANAISKMREKALYTLIAVVCVPVVSALLYRFL